MIWARPGGTVARVGFKPTTPCVSPTRDRGAALRHVPAGMGSRRPSDADVRDWDDFLSLSLSLSLSSDYKDENVGRASFFLPFSLSPR
jgi:hypothetical protein